MEIVSRADAKSQGLKRYFTGKPCSRGHVDARLVSTGMCRECGRQHTAKHRAADHASYLDKRREYRAGRAEIERAQSRASYARNRESRLESRKEYYRNNKDAEANRSRRYLANNRETQLERMRLYRIQRQEIRTALEAKRRAKKRLATPSWFGELDGFVWQEAAHLAILRRDATGIDWAADHMIPLACRKACGLHVWNNCQVIPAKLNGFKHNKLVLTEPYEWLRHL